jgi:DNA mismatch repair protein MutS
MATLAMSSSIYEEYEYFVKKYQADYDTKDIVVLMQVGSFYEVYSANDGLINIKEIADILNVTLTRKNKNITEISKSNCYMLGFPLYTLSKYTSMLLQNNFTIVIVNQRGEGKNIKRVVEEVLSPGVQIDNVVCEDNNFLASIYIEEQRDMRSQKDILNIGMSYIDLSTGENYVFETSSKENDKFFGFDEVYKILTSTHPKEILIFGNSTTTNFEDLCKYLEIDNKCVHDKLNKFDKELLKIHYQQQLLGKVFNETFGLLTPIEFLNLEKTPIGLISYVGLLQFSYLHNEHIVDQIKKPVLIESDKYVTLSYNVVKQLNIIDKDCIYGSLLHILNRCKTSIGKRRYKERLLNPIFDTNVLMERYKRIDYMMDGNRYQSVRRDLENITDIERQFRRITLNKLQPFELCSLQTSLLTLIGLQKHGLSFKDEEIRSSKTILSFIEVIDEDIVAKCNIDNLCVNIFNKGVFTDIDEISEKINQITNNVDLLVGALNKHLETPIFKLEFSDKDLFQVYVTIKRYEQFQKSFPKRIEDYKIETKKASPSSSNFKISTVSLKILNEQYQILKEELRFIMTEKYKAFLNELSSFKQEFETMIRCIAQVDIDATNAENAKEYAYTCPIIRKHHEHNHSWFSAKSIRHPMIERIQDKLEYIPNDISLCDTEMDGVLLYGINASGKSSLMKSVGLCIIMASAGMYVPSSEFVFYPYRKIFTRIPSGDNLFKGHSTFTNEISELRRIIQRADEHSLVIGDELCSGTETISAMSIIAAGISELCERKTSFIFATHLHDLVNIKVVKEQTRMGIFHLNVFYDEKNEKLIYDRKLKKGQGKTLYGLEVCKSLDLPSAFLKKANTIRQEILDIENKILSYKSSRYNSKLYKDVCAVCRKNSSTETHHIIEQHKANENGFIGHVHKNRLFNLVGLCEKCHIKVHQGQLVIYGYHQTSNGIELDVCEKNLNLKLK